MNKGDKIIITLGDRFDCGTSSLSPLYRVLGSDKVFSEKELEKFEIIDEEKVYYGGESAERMEKEKHHDEAWDCIKKISDMDRKQRHEIFKMDNVRRILDMYSPRQAIAMVNKTAKEEIQVGDECKYKDSANPYSFVITSITDNKFFNAFYLIDGDVIESGTLSIIKKTGIHHPEIAKMMIKMQENHTDSEEDKC